MDRCSSSLRRSYQCDREEGGRAREPRCWNSLVLEVRERRVTMSTRSRL